MGSSVVQSVHMRLVRAVAALACTAALVTGCGGDTDDQGESAQDKYCTEYRAFYEATNAGRDASDAAVIQRMKSFATKAAGLETPEQMSEDAEAGLKTWIELMNSLDADASQQDVIALDQGLSAAETAQMDAFYAYSNKTCLSAGQS